MNILVTGAKGFVGRNLCENLKNLRDGKNRTRPNLRIEEIYEYDIDSPSEEGMDLEGEIEGRTSSRHSLDFSLRSEHEDF